MVPILLGPAEVMEIMSLSLELRQSLPNEKEKIMSTTIVHSFKMLHCIDHRRTVMAFVMVASICVTRGNASLTLLR